MSEHSYIAQSVPRHKTCNFDWKSYLQLAFTELNDNNIIAILEPPKTNGFVDDAWYDIVKGLCNYKDMLKKVWNIDLIKENYTYNTDDIPFLFYMEPHPTRTSIFLQFNLNNMQKDIVDKILSKHFNPKFKDIMNRELTSRNLESYYVWDKSDNSTIEIKSGIILEPLTLEERYSQEILDMIFNFEQDYPSAKYMLDPDNYFRWTSPIIKSIIEETPKDDWKIEEYKSELMDPYAHPKKLEEELRSLFTRGF